jgi:HYR domain/GEVED domain
VIYTATDAKNNKATCSFTVTVSNPCANDTIKPVFDICPPNITKTTADTAAIATWTPPTATDNCGVPSLSSTHNSGNSFRIGTTTVIYTATDAKNNKATCSFTVTVSNPCANDTTKPVFDICPPNITKTTADTAAIATWTPPTATDNCGVPSVSSTHNSGNSFRIGTTTVVYTATDAKNNKATCSFTVTVSNPCANDTTKPVFDICPPNITKTTADSAAIATWTPPTATDNCGVPSVSSTHNSGNSFKIGTTTVIYTATDAKNNKATCSFTVTVSNPCANDTTKPVFANCPANISSIATGGTATATWTAPTATDNCGVPSLSSTHNSGATFPIGTTAVIYTATDAKNNKNTCTFNVIVSPANTNYCGSKSLEPYQEWVSGVKFGTINNTPQANEGKSINWSVVGYSDFTGLITNVNRGQGYPLNVLSSVSWSGRSADLYCRVWIDFNGDKTFDDTEKVLEGRAQNPFISTVNIPSAAISGNTRMRVSLKWGGFPTACENFTSGEVEDYAINIGGSDCTTDAVPPVFANCPTNISATTSGTDAAATWTPPTATDNCTTTPTVTSSHNSGAIFPIGTTTVTYTATDAKNNRSTCVFTVTVTNPCANDVVAPVFTNCPNNISRTTQDTAAIATWTPPTATDNCTTPSLSSTYNSGASFKIGTTTVVYTATDAKNNRSTCSFTVTVTNPCANDTVPPVFTYCPINIMQTTPATTLTVAWPPPIATDNCTANPTLSSTHQPNTAFPIGVTTVIYTAKDARNNANTCSFTISVFPPNVNYCASKSSEPYQEWVSGVQFGTMTNLIQANQGKSINWSVVGYSDFTSLAATVSRGQTYPLSITPGTSWSGRLPNLYCRVWIDFNGDKTFDDAEKVMEGRALNVFSGNVLIPTNTTTGNTRMRVSLKWGSLPTACESFIPGEVEDYTVTIR